MIGTDFAIVFLPLLGAALAWILGRRWGDRAAQIASVAGVVLSAILSVYVLRETFLSGEARHHVIAPWIEAGGLKAHWAIRIDMLSAIMISVVTLVSSMVHIYAIGYMAHDKSVPRFMAYLSLFTFFMLMLVVSDNLLQMFFGWEGVGLASYLLIGFWYDRAKANKAAMKAFLVNRVGDVGFILGLFGCFQFFGTLDIQTILSHAPEVAGRVMTIFGHHVSVPTVLAFLLFIGAMGKSAQLGLHVWLPDAMEGPTPVSALIHAATMVTAGVFMLARLSPLFELAPAVLSFITIIGAVTAVFAATIGLTQFDIKRVIAYSTMSQLGYMFFAAGVSAYGASIFHLMTHAFFKALLFLCAGSVIHALGGEQDMRKMGGLARKLPVTYALMWIGSLALAGIGVEGLFGFSGFYSKDMILEAAFARGTATGYVAYGLGLLAAFMTGFYSWRLLILTFHGDPRMEASRFDHAHEAPWVMLSPLLPLAAGAVFAGWSAHDLFARPADGAFWRGSIGGGGAGHGAVLHAMPEMLKLFPLAFALSGLFLAVWFYLRRPDLHYKVVKTLAPVHKVAKNKYYFDEIYDILFIRSVHAIGDVLHRRGRSFDGLYDFIFVRSVWRFGSWLWRKADVGLIDKIGPDGVAALAQWIAGFAQRAQTGYIFHYAFVMAAGMVAMLGWAYLKG